MINNFKIKLVSSLGILTVCVLLCFSCDTDLVETYDQYIPENVVSIAKPDSVAAVSSGYNKLSFKVFVNSDPKIKKAVIALFDDDVDDDDDKIVATIDINRTIYAPEIYEVEIDMPEGGNEYFVHLENVDGEKGIKYDVFGTVLGDDYIASLLPREYTGINLDSETEATITWVSNRMLNEDLEEEVVNPLLVKSVMTYTSSVDGSVITVEVDESEDATMVTDFISEGTFSYTTFYRLEVDSPVVFESNPTEGMFPFVP